MNRRSQYEIAIFASGGYQAVAAELGVSRQTLYNWRDAGIPAHWFEAFLAVTGAEALKLKDWQKEAG